jgi:hypothetical protein
MKIVLTTLKKVLFWSYDRGTWQYDVMCVLILAFLFFAPNSLIGDRQKLDSTSVMVSLDELGSIDQNGLNEKISEYLVAKYGPGVTVHEIEPLRNSSGELKGYSARLNSD